MGLCLKEYLTLLRVKTTCLVGYVSDTFLGLLESLLVVWESHGHAKTPLSLVVLPPVKPCAVIALCYYSMLNESTKSKNVKFFSELTQNVTKQTAQNACRH